MSLLSFVGIFLLASSAVFSAPAGYGSGSLLLDQTNYGGRGQVLLDSINSYGNRAGLLLDPINSYGNRGSLLLDSGVGSYGGGLINRPVLDLASSSNYGSSYGGYSAPSRQFDVVSSYVPKTVEEDTIVPEVQHNIRAKTHIIPHFTTVQRQSNMVVPTTREVTEAQDVLVQRPTYNNNYGNSGYGSGSGYGASNYGGGYSAPQFDRQTVLRKKLIQENMIVPKVESSVVEQDEVVRSLEDIPTIRNRVQQNFKTVTERRDQLVERPTYNTVQLEMPSYGNYAQAPQFLDARRGGYNSGY